jgi:hypothetical protein
MANTIITKNSATATAVPTAGQLVQGELAVNVTDKRLFTENSGGTVVEVGTNPSTIAVAGNATVGGTLGVTGLATLASSTLSANPTLSAGTANGVTYLNGSKVLTSGSALTTNGSSLGVGSSDFGGAGSINVSVGVAGTTTGGLQLWSTTTGQHYVQFGDGTAGAATYAGAIGYSHATDQMFFYANAAEQMRLTSTGLGIGTSSPAAKLHVVNTAYIKGSASTDGDKGITIGSGSGAVNTSSHAIRTGGGLGNLLIIETETANSSGQIVFNTNSAERMRLDSSGNLGLGVTPSAWYTADGVTRALQISGTGVLIANNGSMRVMDNAFFNTSGAATYISNGYAEQYLQNGGQHAWYTAPSGTAGNTISFTQAMTLTAAGNLGIGTSSPSAKLNVVGGNSIFSNTTSEAGFNSTGSNRYSLISAASTSGTMYLGVNGTSAGAEIDVGGILANASFFGARTNNATQFLTNNSVRATITSSGALCINRTDQQNDERLAVLGNVGQQCMSLKSPITTAYDMINIINGNGQVGTIQTNGSATSYNTSSDYRLKENVVTEWDATTRLKQLKPSRFNFIADADTTVDGFLAHEVQEIVPEAITGTKDAVDADGNPKYQGIDQSKLVPLLVKTIQELEARLTALEGN